MRLAESTRPIRKKKATLYFLVLGFLAVIVGSLFGPFQALNYGNVDATTPFKAPSPFVQSYYQWPDPARGAERHRLHPALRPGHHGLPAGKGASTRPNMGLMWLSWWMAFIGLVMAACSPGQRGHRPTPSAPRLSGWLKPSVGRSFLRVLPPGRSITSPDRRRRYVSPSKVTPGRSSAAAGLRSRTIAPSGLCRQRLLLLPHPRAHPGGPLRPHPLVDGHPGRLLLLGLPTPSAAQHRPSGRLAASPDPMARLASPLPLFSTLRVPLTCAQLNPARNFGSQRQFPPSPRPTFVAVPSLGCDRLLPWRRGLEFAGRMRGGKGLLGWIKALPWDNPLPSWPRSWASSASSPGGPGAW